MGISNYLKQIGRGSKGASDLSRADARELFDQLLGDHISDLELGAFCIAMRLKGETAQELLGFYDALSSHLPSIRSPHNTVVLTSYNGARKTNLLTPLLAKLLTAEGFSVFIHGAHEEPGRLSTEQVFGALGWPIAKSIDDIGSQLTEHYLAYCPLTVLCPSLSRLLSVRQTLGLRNTGHIIAKLINPIQTLSLQVCNYTHPAYPAILDTFFNERGANVVFMRGHEGEPVASPHRLPTLHLRLNGGEISLDTDPFFDDEPSALAQTTDLDQTVYLYEALFKGDVEPPATLVKQVQYLVQSMNHMLASSQLRLPAGRGDVAPTTTQIYS